MSEPGTSPRTAARSRAEARRSESLQIAALLAEKGVIQVGAIVGLAGEFEAFLRRQDGSNLTT